MNKYQARDWEKSEKSEKAMVKGKFVRPGSKSDSQHYLIHFKSQIIH